MHFWIFKNFWKIFGTFWQCSKIFGKFRKYFKFGFEVILRVLKIFAKIKLKQKQKAGIVTSLNDTSLAKVTYGKYATRVLDEVAYGIYEWFSSQ